MRKPNKNQVKLAAYLAAGRHVVPNDTAERRRRGLPLVSAKPIRQIAEEICIHHATVRWTLKRHYYDVWLEWWPSADALFDISGVDENVHQNSSSVLSDLPAPNAETFEAARELKE